MLRIQIWHFAKLKANRGMCSYELCGRHVRFREVGVQHTRMRVASK